VVDPSTPRPLQYASGDAAHSPPSDPLPLERQWLITTWCVTGFSATAMAVAAVYALTIDTTGDALIVYAVGLLCSGIVSCLCLVVTVVWWSMRRGSRPFRLAAACWSTSVLLSVGQIGLLLVLRTRL
jgi:hypothetical protein